MSEKNNTDIGKFIEWATEPGTCRSMSIEFNHYREANKPVWCFDYDADIGAHCDLNDAPPDIQKLLAEKKKSLIIELAGVEQKIKEG